jgi:hypothetical protein
MVVGPEGAQSERNITDEDQQKTTVLLYIKGVPMLYVCRYQIANLITAFSTMIALRRQNKNCSIFIRKGLLRQWYVPHCRIYRWSYADLLVNALELKRYKF